MLASTVAIGEVLGGSAGPGRDRRHQSSPKRTTGHPTAWSRVRFRESRDFEALLGKNAAVRLRRTGRIRASQLQRRNRGRGQGEINLKPVA
jgi:hypothetical protein